MPIQMNAKKTDSALGTLPESMTAGTLKFAQRLHALLILLVPLFGSIAAFAMAARGGVDRIEIGSLLGMYLLTMLGISLGFHRYLTHRAFRAGPGTGSLLVILGSMAAQGPPIYWATNHRRHHRFSDRDGDPHSPYVKGAQPLGGLRGLWHAHIGWTFDHEITNSLVYGKDLLRDPLLMKINRLYFVWVFLGFLLPALLGGLVAGSWAGFCSGFLWGGLVRSFFSYHATASVNSLTHWFGTVAFQTHDGSRNNILLALPTLGEAWHNNHHAFPSAAVFGLRWWQVDLGGWVISLLEKAGWVWEVKTPTSENIEARAGGSGNRFADG